MAKKAAQKRPTKVVRKKPTVTRTAAVKARPAAPKAPAKAPPKPLPRKGFTKKELDHFRHIIVEKRKEILDELESLKASMMDVQTGEYSTESSMYSLHMEQGTDAMEREKVFLFASREGKFLNYLDDALIRIENGTYGFCSDCGKLIDKERLEAVPHAQQCVSCKQKKGPSGSRL